MSGNSPLVLAISPSPRGFAFVVFYKPDCPIDWGVKEVRGGDKNDRTARAVAKLFAEYQPSTLVIEDAKRGRRGVRICTLLDVLDDLGIQHKAAIAHFSRVDISNALPGRPQTKPEIAKAVAERLPAIASHLPGERKIWMSESRWQSLFDAAALGMAHYFELAPVNDTPRQFTDH